MNLIIDIGNSYVKLAIFKEKELAFKDVVLSENMDSNIKRLLKTYPKVKKVIIASVGKAKVSIKKSVYQLILDADTKLPFKNSYATPKTLGVDRIALVSASVDQFPDNNVLIIDAGTCITYDFISSDNEYFGGAISPGIHLRYQSLHNLTANLPLLKAKAPKSLIGNSTAESIHSGVINGIVNELDGVIKAYQEKYSDLTVILTGGDTDFLAKRLKSSIFANSNFLLEGLNFILEYNSN